MRIDPSSSKLPVIHALKSESGKQALQGASSTHSAAARSGDLKQLVQKTSSGDEVRGEVVDAIKTRLRAGIYLTHEAALNTARAILELQD